MIDYLNKIFEIGDDITISVKQGTMEGKIEVIGDDFIVLRSSSGDIVGVKEDAIKSFAKPGKYRGESERNGHRRPIFRQFKAGDRIPLNELRQRDPTLAQSWKRRQEKEEWQIKRQGLVREVISEVLAANRPEDNAVVPAQGAIVELQPSFQFGFIDDMQTGDRYFFNRSDLVDSSLLDESGEQIEVVYQRSKNHKGPAARCVHRPKSVRELVEMTLELVEEDDFFRAEKVIDNVLAVLPGNESAQTIQEVLEDLSRGGRGHYKRKDTEDNDGNAYRQARNFLTRKEYDKALDYYYDALESGERTTNCIKEITQVYISMHAQETDPDKREDIRQRGLEFIEEHKDQLPSERSTLYSLENIYFALGDYDQHREIVDKIIVDSHSREDWAQYVFYQNKSAQNYLRVRDYEAALKSVEEGLSVESDNPHLLKTQQSILSAQNPDHYSSLDASDDEDYYDDEDDRFSKYY